MNKKTMLTYLKGYLEAIAMMNSFVNDGKTYTIDLLPKSDEDLQKTLSEYLKPVISIELEEVEGPWQNVLKKELQPYFSQIILEVFLRVRNESLNESNIVEINSFKNDYYFDADGWIKSFLVHLEKLVPQTAKLQRVRVNLEGFYENYYHDYLFDLENEVLFLHFGSSD